MPKNARLQGGLIFIHKQEFPQRCFIASHSEFCGLLHNSDHWIFSLTAPTIYYSATLLLYISLFSITHHSSFITHHSSLITQGKVTVTVTVAVAIVETRAEQSRAEQSKEAVQ
jgi:uncharacterized membrane protein